MVEEDAAAAEIAGKFSPSPYTGGLLNSRNVLIALTAAGTLGVGSAAQAAVVTFTTQNLSKANNPTSFTYLDNTGDELAAINYVRANRTNPTPDPLIDGIQFTGTTAAVGTLGRAGTNYTTNATGIDTNRASGVNISSEIYPLVLDAGITANDNTAFQINLNTLTIGREYRLQTVFSSDNNTATGRTVTATSGGSNSGSISYGTNNGPALITGTFTADAGIQNFSFAGTGTSNRAQVSGFVLQELLPEIAVSFGANDVADGDNTPSTGEGTDFGTTTVGTPITNTFTVSNIGAGTLTLGPAVVPAGFSFSGLPSSIAAGGSANFNLTLDAAAPGTYSGTFSFANNDANENPFNFDITGQVNAIPEPASLALMGLGSLLLLPRRKRA